MQRSFHELMLFLGMNLLQIYSYELKLLENLHGVILSLISYGSASNAIRGVGSQQILFPFDFCRKLFKR